jgi:cobalt-zinc-cadmium efflux system outer membrane protein
MFFGRKMALRFCNQLGRGLAYGAFALIVVSLLAAPATAFQIQETFRRLLDQQLERSRQNDFTDIRSVNPNERPAVESELSIEPILEPQLPATNGATTQPASPASLEQFEATAIRNHPRLQQLHLEIKALRAESLQQSLPPNPRVGVFGDEVFNNGQAGFYGAFITETHVPQAKLQSRARVKCVEADAVSAQIAMVHQQIKTDVRTAFYKVLIAQRQNELATQLAESYRAAINQLQSLFEAGEATRADILQVEIQFQQAVTSQTDSNAAFFAAWRTLAAVIGDTNMSAEKVDGTLDLLAQQLDFNTVLADLVQRSPELQLAVARIQQAEAVLDRERNGALRNTQTQWTLGRDSTSEDVYAGFQVSVPWQKYNRNQGNISAAESRLQSARLESEVLARQLANRLAQEFQNYEAARRRAEIYVNEVLPKAQEAVQMVKSAFEGGEAGFLELLTSQRTLITATNGYLAALQTLWISRQKIEGLLLSGSLESNNN